MNRLIKNPKIRTNIDLYILYGRWSVISSLGFSSFSLSSILRSLENSQREDANDGKSCIFNGFSNLLRWMCTELP